MKTHKNITVQEAGRLGGQSTLERHGKEYFRRIGNKGGLATAKKFKHLTANWGHSGGRPKRPKLEAYAGKEKIVSQKGETVGPDSFPA